MTTMTKLIEAVPTTLVLEGQEAGAAEGPEYRAAYEAMTKVAATIHSAMARIGMPNNTIGEIEKLVTMRTNDSTPSWHWELTVKVPSMVTNTLVEFTKHLAKTSLPISVVRAPRGKLVRPRGVVPRYSSAA